MFDVSYCVAEGLRADGYRVVLTKKRAMASVGLAKRAEIATKSKADLAISVHNDHSQGPEFQATYDQRGRRDPDGELSRHVPRHRGQTHRVRPPGDRPEEPAVRQDHRRSPHRGPGPGGRRTRELLQRAARRSSRATSPWSSCWPRCRGSTTRWAPKTEGDVSTAISIPTETRYAQGLLLGVERAVPLAARRGRPAQRGIPRTAPLPGQASGAARRRLHPSEGLPAGRVCALARRNARLGPVSRVFNFSAGPATLPEEVLRQAAAEMLDWGGSGQSVMEMSHRGPDFMSIAAAAEADSAGTAGHPRATTRCCSCRAGRRCSSR